MVNLCQRSEKFFLPLETKRFACNGKVSTRERYNISSQHKMRNLVTAQSEIYGPKVYINFFCLAIRLLETNEYNNLRCSRC